MQLVGAGLAGKTDDSGGPTLVRGRGVLRFYSYFVDTILRNIQCRNDGGRVVFGDAERAAVEHVVDRAHKRAVNRVGGDVNPRTSDRDVLNRLHRIARVWRTVDGNDAGAELNEVVNVAIEERDAINLLCRDQGADGRVAWFDEFCSFGDGNALGRGADAQGNVDLSGLIDVDNNFVPGDGSEPGLGSGNLVLARVERDERVEPGTRCHGVQTDASRLVQQGDLGIGNEIAVGVGHGAGNAAASSLTHCFDSSEEEKKSRKGAHELAQGK